jgi:uncharacterized protein DUF6600
MKKTLLSLAIGALLLTTPRAAKSEDVSVDFFYNNLSGGSWVEVADYGYCWQPDVAVGNENWRPYADGYWAYTDLGWTWVSYEDFGWATYHYGRWTRLSDAGWVWVPGRDADLEWGPAWVSWRTGGEYIGWAPLPPETIAVVEGRPLTGHLDVEFNIGPAYYNFVDVRYIGEPVLRERIIAPTHNITYIQQTVNVTNITYKNKTVYNYGPDINVVNRTAARPIQRLRLDREQNVDFATAAKTGGLTKVQGDRLMVAAPARITRSARQIAPQNVKTRVDAAKIDRGWSGVGDEKAQAEFKQRIRTQDVKNVAAPTGAGAASDASTQAGQANEGAERGRRGQRGAGQGQNVTGASPSPAASSAAGAASPAQAAADETRQGAGRGQARQRNRFPQPADQNAPTGTSSPTDSSSTGVSAGGGADVTAGQGQGQGRGRRGENRNVPTPAPGIDSRPAQASPGAGAADQSQATGGESRRERGQMQGNGGRSEAAQGADNQGQGPQGRRFQTQTAETAPGDVQGQGRRQREGQGQAGQAAGRQQGQGQAQRQGQGQGEGRRGAKKDQPEGSPAATPPQ